LKKNLTINTKKEETFALFIGVVGSIATWEQKEITINFLLPPLMFIQHFILFKMIQNFQLIMRIKISHWNSARCKNVQILT